MHWPLSNIRKLRMVGSIDGLNIRIRKLTIRVATMVVSIMLYNWKVHANLHNSWAIQ